MGVCTCGGNMTYLAAADKRVKAVAVAASHLANADILPLLYGSAENVKTLRNRSIETKKRYAQTGENTIIPAYSNTDQTASHVGPMEYYMDKTRGGGVKEWHNEFSVMSWETWLDFDPVTQAAEITTPYLMFHSDFCALPDNAKKAFAAIKGTKELIWGDGYHFDHYDQDKQVDANIAKASTFFLEHLQ